MTIRIDGTNTAANPGITGTDTDTGLQFGTDEVNIVTGGTTRATVDSSGRLLVGLTSDTSNTTLSLQGRSDDSSGGPIVRFKRGEALPTSNLSLGNIFFSDGQNRVGAEIQSITEENWSASSTPTRLGFFTTPSGSTSSAERMRITSGGDLRFNSGFGSVATAYGVRAWCNANTMSANTFNGSGNVSSITDNGSGDYTVNFTTSMPDTGYAVVAMGFEVGSTGTSDGYFTVERATNYSDSMATGSVTVKTNSGGDRNLNLIVVR